MQAVIRTVQQAEAFFGPAYNRGQIDPNNFTGQVSSYRPDSGSQNERESLKMKHLLFCLTLRLSPVLPKKNWNMFVWAWFYMPASLYNYSAYII